MRLHRLIALALTALALTCVPFTAVLRAAMNTNLVAFYPLNEASGNAVDLHAAKTATETVGTIAAVNANGQDWRDFEQGDTEYFARTDGDFTLSGDFTVQVWIKPETLAGNTATYGAGIVSQITGDSLGDWWLSVESGGAVAFAHWANGGGADTNGLRLTGASKVANGTVAHIVARHASGVFTVWVNNVSESLAEQSTTPGWGNRGFNIGRQYTGGGYYYDGLVNRVGIWSRALTDNEIGWLYNEGAGRSFAEFSWDGTRPRLRWVP